MEKKDTLDMIMRLTRASRRRKPLEAEGSRFSRSVFRAMVVLKKEGTMRASELAERLDIRPASLTEQLVRMEGQGLVRRERDPADRRVVQVMLTDEGHRQLDRNREERLAWSKKLQEALTEEEAGQFARLAEKLIAFFEAERGHA